MLPSGLSGNCLVPNRYAEDTQLGSWGKCIPREASFDLPFFDALKSIHDPHSYPRLRNAITSIYIFIVSAQRRQYKIVTSGGNESAAMTPERAMKLREIGFEVGRRQVLFAGSWSIQKQIQQTSIR